MKKLLYLCTFLVALISFTGCYSGRVGVYERPPVRRVMIAPAPYYYHPAPVIVESYGNGRHRGWSHGYSRY